MAKSIQNTQRTGVNPDWLLGGNPGAIENQEREGQSQLVESHDLPSDIRGDRTRLTDAGVLFGAPRPSDPIFCRATLPEGWKKRPTVHSMWSELVDSEGNVRAEIFYKAAFYDRSAFLRVCEPE